MLAFARFSPQSDIADDPLYEVPLRDVLCEREFRFEPRAIPEIVELVSPELDIVPVSVGVKVRAPAEDVTVCPSVKPFQERVDVEKATVVLEVVAYPEPKLVRYVPAGCGVNPKIDDDAVTFSVPLPPDV